MSLIIRAVVAAFVCIATASAFAAPPSLPGSDSAVDPALAGVSSETPWTVPLEVITAEVRPLRVDALVERAEFWMAAYQEAVGETAQLAVSGAGAADEATDSFERKNDILDRFEIVIDSLEEKGGDASEYRDFIKATTSINVGAVEPEALGALALAWLGSEDGGIAIGLAIAKFIAIVVVSWFLAGILAGAAKTGVKRLPNASSLLQEFVVGSVKRLVQVIGLVIAVSFLGVNIGPLLAAIGAAGLVIGLALQGTLSNFASGLLILVYRPYDVGDVIKGGGVTGKVEAMNLVSTRVSTFDNQVIFVPNNQIWNGDITNITARDTRRVDLIFGIGYADDMAKAEAIILDVITNHEKVLKDPAPVIKVHELADNSVNFIARPWSMTSDYWDVYWDVTRRVKERFDAEGVGIPFPQRDLHIPGGIEVTVKNG
ncbi:MAG: mechanosensitive ion channel family protein [Planctomycetota bacterium]